MRTSTVAAGVARQLSDAINRGVYPPGSRLPGERQLAEQLHVSRSTLRAGLRGLKATAAVLEQAPRSATIDEAEKLAIPPGGDVLVLVRLRGMNSTPICVDTNVIPMTIGAPLLDADLTDRSLYEALEELC